MKKYIFTESQLQSVLNHELNEQILAEQRGQFLKIKDLAEISSRMGLDEKTMFQVFMSIFKNEGDDGLIKAFKDVTDLELEDMGYGRYQIK